jgi:hypothetical protein
MNGAESRAGCDIGETPTHLGVHAAEHLLVGRIDPDGSEPVVLGVVDAAGVGRRARAQLPLVDASPAQVDRSTPLP